MIDNRLLKVIKVHLTDSPLKAFKNTRLYENFSKPEELQHNIDQWIDKADMGPSSPNISKDLLKEANEKGVYKIIKHKTRYLWIKEDGDKHIILGVFTKYAQLEDLYLWLSTSNHILLRPKQPKHDPTQGHDYVSRNWRSFVAAPAWPDLPIQPKPLPTPKRKRGRPRKVVKEKVKRRSRPPMSLPD